MVTQQGLVTEIEANLVGTSVAVACKEWFSQKQTNSSRSFISNSVKVVNYAVWGQV